MHRRAPRDDEGGFIAPVAGLVIFVLAMIAMGGVGIGRMAAMRSDLQRAADSAGLAAAELIRKNGLPFDASARSAATSLASPNGKWPIDFTWRVQPSGDHIDIEVTASAELGLSQMIWERSETLTRSATTRLSQQDLSNIDERRPKLTLALDYSGSMSGSLVDDAGVTTEQRLEESVRALLDADLPIDYSAILWSGSNGSCGQPTILGTAGFGQESRIRQLMNDIGPSCMTYYGDALRAAHAQLRSAENTGRYILFISDGAPNDPSLASNPGYLRSVARTLWNDDITIFTLHIRNSAASAGATNYLLDMSGSADAPASTRHYLTASTAAGLLDAFTDVVSELLCRTGPLDPAPSSPGGARLFLSRGGEDTPLAQVDDVFASSSSFGFVYEPATGMVSLTEAACDAVVDDGYALVARTRSGALIK